MTGPEQLSQLPIGVLATFVVGDPDRTFCPPIVLRDAYAHLLGYVPLIERQTEAFEACHVWVVEQHPHLAVGVEGYPLPGAPDVEVLQWLAGLESQFGPDLLTAPVPADQVPVEEPPQPEVAES